MSKLYPPSVFVSSTCKDLAQIRSHLRDYIKSIGFDPILSEFLSFTVNPDIDTIENCKLNVKEKADIFILVIGNRYGSETENGMSVTNLEYIEACAKGIPCYIFVQNSIRDEFLKWQSNRSAFVLDNADSPKLLEFLESLYNQKEMKWIFTFDSAEDIIDTLRKQFSYLFMDALTIRRQVLKSDLSMELPELSTPALRLLMEKPIGWEGRLFTTMLSDEIFKRSYIKKDYDFALTLGRFERINGRDLTFKWISKKMQEFLYICQSISTLIESAIPKAVNESSKKDIIYVTKRLADSYQRILEWAAEFRHTMVDDEFLRLMKLFSQTVDDAIKQIEAFPNICNNKIDDAIKQYDGSKLRLQLELTLSLNGLPEIDHEIRFLKAKRLSPLEHLRDLAHRLMHCFP